MASPVVSPLAPTAEPHSWRWVSSIDVRQGDHPAIPAPLPGMLEGRVTLLAGAGGSGKTTLCEQLLRHLCNGHRLGSFELPDQLMIGWALFLEDVEVMAQDRSLRAAWMGALEEDSKRERWDSPVRYLFGRDFWMSDLRKELQEARFLGVTPGVVVIDHMRLLFKAQPAGTSPNDWERANLRMLVELGDEFGVHFIVLTHLNKAGKVSGTTELINSVDSAYLIEPSPEDPHHYASLTCLKMRMSPETDFALRKTRSGTWEFTDTVFVSESQAQGVARDIIGVLRRDGPMTLSQLITHPQIGAPRETIRKALQRSRQREWLRLYRGHWEAIPGRGDELMNAPRADAVCPLPAPAAIAPPPPAPLAAVPTPRPEPAAAAADDEPGRWDPEPEPEDTGFPALQHLKESIKRSRMHPLPVVPLERRDQLPWSLMTERMGGEPSSGRSRRFERPVPMGGQLLRVDRNGSFPSACSSVRVAPNALVHTGPLDSPEGRAGIFLIERVIWKDDRVPHPLGRIVEHGDGPDWVTTPHVALLQKLAMSGRIKMPAILDSWTGRGNGSLFEHFYKEARAARAELAPLALPGTPEEAAYQAYKARVSTALRLLWPKKARSPFWRPDWRLSVVAEAAVRHWLRADEAVRLGEGNVKLVRFSNVDEAWFWTEDGRLPAPYEAGLGFGQVKLKPISEDGSED